MSQPDIDVWRGPDATQRLREAEAARQLGEAAATMRTLAEIIDRAERSASVNVQGDRTARTPQVQDIPGNVTITMTESQAAHLSGLLQVIVDQMMPEARNNSTVYYFRQFWLGVHARVRESGASSEVSRPCLLAALAPQSIQPVADGTLPAMPEPPSPTGPQARRAEIGEHLAIDLED